MDPLKWTTGGVPLAAWLIIVVVLSSTVPTQSTISVTDKAKIEKGFEAGKAIVDLIKEKEFKEALTSVAKNIAPFLGAFGPFLSLILAFIPTGDSATVTLLKEMMRRIDNRFNQVDTRFDEIERLIDWTDVAVNFGEIEQRINAMDVEFKLLYSGTAPAENRKRVFISHFESTFQLSGLRLYNAIMDRHGTFQENLGESVMRFTKNDRKKTQDFLLGTMRLLLRAVKIELAYYNVKGFDSIAQQRKNGWQTRILAVKSNFENIDRRVKNKYHDQSLVDIKKYSTKYYGVNNEDFSQTLYDMLKEKYYWRVWFVVVYNPIHGWNRHTVGVCGGHILFRQDGRNIVVASKDRNARKVDMQRATQSLNNVPGLTYNDLAMQYELARRVYRNIDKVGACGAAVIVKHRSDVWYRAELNRVVHRHLRVHFPFYEDYFHMMLFG